MSAPAVRQRTATRAPDPVPLVSVRPVAAVVQRSAEPRVSTRADPAEKEAEATAKRVMRIQTPHLSRFAESARLIQRHTIARAEKTPGLTATAPAGVGAAIASARGSGTPLPVPVRGFMEARFGADFSKVRVHTGDTAARLSRQVNAQAFTLGSDIFFGKDRWRPDTSEGLELLAHELTHTVQQGAAPQGKQPGVQRSEEAPHIGERVSTPHVQRLGISDALDYFARQANNIPGFRMFTIVLGVNPINMSRVDRSAANILRAVVEFIPGGGLIVQALDAYGVFDRAGQWIEEQLDRLGITGQAIRDSVNRFLDSLGWRDIFDLGGVWNRAVRIITDPIGRILTLLRSVGGEILRMIKDAVLMPLARLASQTRGWDLLCAVLGRNPITGETVPRNAETLIGGFMRLIGQEEIWQNIQRSGAIARAWAWFQGALGELMGFVSRIPDLFIQALRELEIADLVLLPRAFLRVGRVFEGFAVEFVSWAGNTIWNLLEIIFAVVAPGAISYLQRARQAFRNILRDPIGFVGNLVRAGIQGMRQFARNFLTHLRTALVGWLTGALSGANIYIPQSFTLSELVKFVLSVLGLTWQNIRQKLVRAIGEPAVAVLERTFEIVQTLVTRGPAAAWEKIAESLTNLRTLVIEQVMTFVRDRIITAAITRLVSMLNPAGAFIQAIIAIYNTIMFFVERMRQLVAFVRNAVDAIHPISIGDLTRAANAMERGLVQGLTLVISFLARLVGLGRVSDAVTNVINRVRQPIDRALDRVVNWIVEQGRRLGRLALQAGVPQDPVERVRRAGRDAVAIARRLRGRVTRPILDSALGILRTRYGLSRIEPREQNGQWSVFTKVNAEHTEQSGIPTNPDAPASGAAGGGFPYRIAERARNDLSPVLASNGGGSFGAPPQRHSIAYVGNTPISRGTIQAYAMQYLDAWGGRSGRAIAQQRFALVMGVNMFEDLASLNVATVRSMVQAGAAGVPYPWASFGFVWRPNWVRGTRPITIDVVRSEIARDRARLEPLAVAEENRFRATIRSSVPIGPIRDLIFSGHPQTQRYVADLRRRADAVFVHVTDPDTVNFNPASSNNEALFRRYDEIIPPVLAAIRQDAARANRTTLIVSGGYEFEMRPLAGAPINPEQADDFRTYFAGTLGRAVQTGLASVDARAVYFTEANLLIQVTPTSIRGSFSKRRAPFTGESQRIIQTIQGGDLDNARLVFDPRASLVTGAREFAVVGGTARTTWQLAQGITIEDVERMTMQRQSPVSERGWVVNILNQYNLGRTSTVYRPIQAIWQAYFPTSDRYGGLRSLTSLRNAVRGNAWRSGAGYGQVAPQYAADPLVMQPDGRPTVYVRLADASARELGTALDRMFNQLGIP